MYSIKDVHNRIRSETLDILITKNTDYRGGSQEDIFSNFKRSLILNVQPTTGLMIRMLDKHQRIRAFINNGSLAVKNESVKDAILDLHNYTSILHGMFNDVKNLDGLVSARDTLYVYSSTLLDKYQDHCVFDILSIAENNMATRANCGLLLSCYTNIAYYLAIYEREDVE